MKKALCLVEFNVPTGFGTVGTNLLNQFYKKLPNIYFDVLSPNYEGLTYQYNDRIRVASAKNLDPQFNDFGVLAAQKYLASGDYDYFFCCNDISIGIDLAPLIKFTKSELKKINVKQFKSFFYFPIDNDFKNLNVFAPKEIPKESEYHKYQCGLEVFDELATYTEFGKNVLLKHQPNLKGKLKVIPHGTSKEFDVIQDNEKLEFRKEYFGENSDKFIFLNLNKNNPRKDLPSTIFAFEDAVKNWTHTTKPFLYLHCIDSPTGWNLKQILNQTTLKENIDYNILDTNNFEFSKVENINKIYNICDIGITTATGGGWELFITECYATKLPLIAPNHTSFKELSYGEMYSTLLKTLYPCSFTFDSIVREQIDIYELSDLMINAPYKIEEYKNKSNKAYLFARQLDWFIISDKFLSFFK